MGSKLTRTPNRCRIVADASRQATAHARMRTHDRWDNAAAEEGVQELYMWACRDGGRGDQSEQDRAASRRDADSSTGTGAGGEW